MSDLNELQEKCEKAKAAVDAYIKCEKKIDRVMVGAAKQAAQDNLRNGTLHLLMKNVEYPLTDEDNAMRFWDAITGFTDKAVFLKEDLESSNIDDNVLYHYFEDYITCMKYYQVMNNYLTGMEDSKENIVQMLQSDGLSYSAADIAYSGFAENDGILTEYQYNCSSLGRNEIYEGKNAIGGIYAEFNIAQGRLEDAVQAVSDLKEALLEANRSYSTWTDKIEKLPDEDGENSFKTVQQQDAATYEELLREDVMESFVQKMDENAAYIKNAIPYLETYSFMGYQLKDAGIESDTVSDAILEIEIEAITIDEVEKKRDEIISENYITPENDFEGNPVKLEEQTFYESLSKLCTVETTTSQEGSKAGASSIFDLNDFVKIEEDLGNLNEADWSEKKKPSTELEENKENDSNNDNILYSLYSTDTISKDTDVTDSGSRKSAIDQTKSSLSQMQTLLEKLDDILTNNLENLYLMEYGIQMFSYYTVDKDENGNTINGEITSLSGDDLTKHAMYKSEAEYILWGLDSAKDNINRTRMLMYGIRAIFDFVYAFSDAAIGAYTLGIATGLSFGLAFLVPIINFVLKIAVGAAEAAFDVKELMLGRSVPIIKNATNSNVAKALGLSKAVNNQAVTMNYKEYLSIFMMIHMVGTFEKTALARMADCIQLNTENLDITTSYTMIAVSADVKVRTTFLRKASAWSGSNSITSDYYTISYKSCLGY
jgi:hypothetical protein